MSDHTEVWTCCDSTFCQVGMLEHLRSVHGLTAFEGTAKHAQSRFVDGRWIDTYAVTIGGVQLVCEVKEH